MFNKKTVKVGQSLIFNGKEYTHEALSEILKTSVNVGGPESREIDVEFAFECGGKYYFTYLPEDLTARRYKEYLTRHEELRMGISFDNLKELQKRKRKILQDGKNVLNWDKYRNVDLEIDFRLDNAPFADTMYNLASVMFAEHSEDLTTYDIGVNNAKIAHWKAHQEPADFFLRTPVKELIGLKNLSSEDLKGFLRKGEMAIAVLNSSISEYKTD